MGDARTVIFDLDGTLLHTLPTVRQNGNTALVELGLRPVGEADFRDLIRYPVATYYRHLLELGGAQPDQRTDQSPELLAALIRRDHELYAANACDSTEPFPGIIELLRALRARGIKTAVLTNKPAAHAVKLIEANFPGLFDVVDGYVDGRAPKPDPSTVSRVLSQLGAPPGTGWMVGDTDVDAYTARNGGLFFAAVGWGYGDKDAWPALRPDFFAERAADLLRLFPDDNKD
ncbi:MAG: HAD family hydrolase [Peptococcaceae bacterium]|jgi:phosphoglycolate phosphatase|nr:HAD family hydrolase [Peptococcaceae bacterium]